MMSRLPAVAALMAAALVLLGPAASASARTAPDTPPCGTWSLVPGGPYTGEATDHPVLVVEASVAFCAGEEPASGNVWMVRYDEDIGRRTTWQLSTSPGTAATREWYVHLAGMPAVVCVSDAYDGPLSKDDRDPLVTVANHACLALALGPTAEPRLIAIPPDDLRVTKLVRYLRYSGDPACGSCV